MLLHVDFLIVDNTDQISTGTQGLISLVNCFIRYDFSVPTSEYSSFAEFVILDEFGFTFTSADGYHIG